MIKKSLPALTLAAAMLALGAAFAAAQASFDQIPAAVLERMAKEPPLTQADVDAYIKILPDMGKVMADSAALVKLYESVGLTESRFSVVVPKISFALVEAQAGDAVDYETLPEFLRPSAADVTLVKKNSEAVQKALEAMKKNMTAQ
ncbi:MAG: hypothetical protein LBS31_11190 [Candidatus Adiutrix sp.]|jgi:hypothetical protein|nr:hypothetical protein [Candidatus Adiutrix sp.]